MPTPKNIQIVARINAILTRTEDAFSAPTYGPSEWRRAIRLLIDKGHDDRTIEAILKSKWMRWAADNRPAGTDPRGEDIIAYMRKIKPEQIEALVAESFGESAGPVRPTMRYINVSVIDDQGVPASWQVMTSDLDEAMASLQARIERGERFGHWDRRVIAAFVFDTATETLRRFNVEYVAGLRNITEVK